MKAKSNRTYKSIFVSQSAYDEIRRFADARHATIGGTIEWLLDLVKQEKHATVFHTSTAQPLPDAEPIPYIDTSDASPVPVVEVEPVEL